MNIVSQSCFNDSFSNCFFKFCINLNCYNLWNRWIFLRPWPSCSPECSPCDFYLLGYIKNSVRSTYFYYSWRFETSNFWCRQYPEINGFKWSMLRSEKPFWYLSRNTCCSFEYLLNNVKIINFENVPIQQCDECFSFSCRLFLLNSWNLCFLFEEPLFMRG